MLFTVENKGVFYYTFNGERKRSFNIYNFANHLKNKYLALITTRFWPYLVPVPVAVKVEFYGGDSGKPDYRNHTRTGRVDDR